MEFHDKIYVAGHTGMVGSAIVRILKKQAYTNLVLRTSKELSRNTEDPQLMFTCRTYLKMKKTNALRSALRR